MRATNIGANILFVVVVVADVDEYVRQNTNSLTNNNQQHHYIRIPVRFRNLYAYAFIYVYIRTYFTAPKKNKIRLFKVFYREMSSPLCFGGFCNHFAAFNSASTNHKHITIWHVCHTVYKWPRHEHTHTHSLTRIHRSINYNEYIHTHTSAWYIAVRSKLSLSLTL